MGRGKDTDFGVGHHQSPDEITAEVLFDGFTQRTFDERIPRGLFGGRLQLLTKVVPSLQWLQE